ncbi:MAG: hypothetical protein RBJ76_13700 [Stenomitos frigidus ULC029]
MQAEDFTYLEKLGNAPTVLHFVDRLEISFAVHLLTLDGLCVPPFTQHQPRQGLLQQQGLTAEAWLQWVKCLAQVDEKALFQQATFVDSPYDDSAGVAPVTTDSWTALSTCWQGNPDSLSYLHEAWESFDLPNELPTPDDVDDAVFTSNAMRFLQTNEFLLAAGKRLLVCFAEYPTAQYLWLTDEQILVSAKGEYDQIEQIRQAIGYS